jgi:RHS repeat-associated protein
MGQKFVYDRLNRLKNSQFYYFNIYSTSPWKPTSQYNSTYSYDRNGNILNLSRYEAKNGQAAQMDALTYKYESGTNRLDHVLDRVSDTVFDHDIDSQPQANYYYNESGNLIFDQHELQSISWTPSGKVGLIKKADGSIITFLYDATGNRVVKKVNNIRTHTETAATFYVPDAQGNIMATYNRIVNYSSEYNGIVIEYWLDEQPIYGSGRLGVRTGTNYGVRGELYDSSGEIVMEDNIPAYYSGRTTRRLGRKQYELTDHLGNVRVLFGDRITGTLQANTLQPNILATNSYYPYGMLIKSLSQNSDSYRWGFNGMEKDDEIKGVGNSYDFVERMYDTRIARFITPDPLMAHNPTWSPFVFGLNNPVVFVDKNGEWPGVTFFFFEFDVGVGLSYGLNYVEQSGIAYDEIGKTHLVMNRAIYIVNQNLEEGSKDPNLVIGASIGLTANAKQNWSAETFAGLIGQGSSTYPVPVGTGAAGLAVNIGFNENEISAGLGIGAGVKISYINTQIKESISLTDEEASKVNSSSDIWANSWIVNDVQRVVDEKGNTVKFKATVATRNIKRELIDTGIPVYSKAVADEKGNLSPEGVWMSESYQTESVKAEKNEKK